MEQTSVVIKRVDCSLVLAQIKIDIHHHYISAECPSGLAIGPDATCSLCPLGTYRNSADQYNCVQCPGDLRTVTPGAVSETECIFSK